MQSWKETRGQLAGCVAVTWQQGHGRWALPGRRFFSDGTVAGLRWM